jgi:hypothetical protein
MIALATSALAPNRVRWIPFEMKGMEIAGPLEPTSRSRPGCEAL